ncbi:MAG: peptidase domain-containing ABC transporter [Alphaproteobacteria bacterium]
MPESSSPCSPDNPDGEDKNPLPVKDAPPPGDTTRRDSDDPNSDIDEAIAPEGSGPVDTLLICFLRLARELGAPVSEADLRAACPVPDSGMNLNVFAMAARRFGYAAEQVPFDEQAALELPAPFVLLGTPKTGALLAIRRDDETLTLFNPVDGKTRIVGTEVARGLATEALAVGRAGPTAPTRSWRAMMGDRVKSVAAELTVASLVVNLFALASPLFVMTVYNKVIGQRSLGTLDVLVMGMLCLYGFDLILRAIRGYISSHTGARMDALIGSEVIHRLVHLPYTHFETTSTGLISERLRQLETIRQFFTGQMPLVLVDLCFVFVFVSVLYYLSPPLANIVLAAIPVFLIISAAFHRVQKKLVEENFTALAAKTSALAETVTNALTVKSLGLESEIEQRWGSRLALSAWTGFRANNLSQLISVFGTVLQQLVSLLIIFMGATLVIAGEITIGALIAGNLLASRALAPMRQVVSAWSQLQEVRAAFRRLDDIMEADTEITPGAFAPAPDLKGKITFDNVSFSYAEGQPPAIRNLDLTIERGEIVAIMGPLGSGKSTLAKLLEGLYKPSGGRILIDKFDISHISSPALRRQLGVVPQETQLFAGTVRENIAMGVNHASPERVVAAAKFVGAHDFIERLPNGYETLLSERGGGLSSGQRQLLCIARAMMRNPRILILDEATSALDGASEETFLRNLRRVAKGRTVILISHRMAPAQIADKVVLIVEGQVAGIGPPGELTRMTKEFAARHTPTSSPAQDAATANAPPRPQNGTAAGPAAGTAAQNGPELTMGSMQANAAGAGK